MTFLARHNLFSLLLFSLLFSCTKNNLIKLDEKKLEDDHSEIQINYSNSTGKNIFNKNVEDSTFIYGVKIWQQIPGITPTEYAFGLFDLKHLDSIKFKAFNHTKYKIETTVIGKGTGEGLFTKNNQFFAPFNAELDNKIHYQVTNNFLPASYQCLMNTEIKSGPSELYNHAELNRFYGEKDYFYPERDSVTHKLLPINIDLYRVSFNLAFELSGEPLKDNQKLNLLIKTGMLPAKKDKDEVYFYKFTNKTPCLSLNKIIAFGLENSQLLDTYYQTMYMDTSYTQTYQAHAFLETYNDKGVPIDSIEFGKSNNIKVKRNHKITYELKIPKFESDEKITFTFKDIVWLDDGVVPYPSK